MAQTIWLVKVRRPGGGSSVITRYAELSSANADVRTRNADYQSESYYVERFDPSTAEWPGVER
ncbi:hypothetical protein [Herbiconiux sp. YIM B11900]|uniref:hypothetical protein n=1 Tax=Herbiconiux sp. YIM B11900 TaxID=3404131 RepID=UPI003F843501